MGIGTGSLVSETERSAQKRRKDKQIFEMRRKMSAMNTPKIENGHRFVPVLIPASEEFEDF